MYKFVETKLFTKLVYDYLNDDEYAAFQTFLAAQPEAGAVVRGSGGVRKVRWSQTGRGKSGGVRIIYFARLKHGEVWLLTIYAKGDVESIPAHILRKIKEEIENEQSET